MMGSDMEGMHHCIPSSGPTPEYLKDRSGDES
jgi:hypothetical protein